MRSATQVGGDTREFMATKFQFNTDDLDYYKELTDVPGVIKNSQTIQRELQTLRQQLKLPKWEEVE